MGKECSSIRTWFNRKKNWKNGRKRGGARIPVPIRHCCWLLPPHSLHSRHRPPSSKLAAGIGESMAGGATTLRLRSTESSHGRACPSSLSGCRDRAAAPKSHRRPDHCFSHGKERAGGGCMLRGRRFATGSSHGRRSYCRYGDRRLKSGCWRSAPAWPEATERKREG